MAKFKIQIEVTYEVSDEIALRQAAEAATKEVNYRSADAAMRLLRHEDMTRLGLPGTKIARYDMRVAEDKEEL